MNRHFAILSSTFLLLLLVAAPSRAQDTVVVQTLTFDSLGRSGVFHFPESGSFEKVLLEYGMRCHKTLISNQTQTEQGCGQWDYNCETFLWDSTRTDSVRSKWPTATVSNYPQFVNFPYTLKPTKSLLRRDEKVVGYSPAPTFTTAVFGLTSTGRDDLFTGAASRTLFVLSAAELKAQGLKTAPIYGLKLDLTGGDTIPDLRVRMHLGKSVILSEKLSHDANFVEVYHAATVLANSTPLYFYKPFSWDGSSDIVIEVSYTSTPNKHPFVNGISFSGQSLTATQDFPEYALSFASSEIIPLPAQVLSSISRQITIAFWAFGDTSKVPGANTVLLEGLDNAGHRQINIHFPWSDGQVYWDCGGDSTGNFDRISKTVSKSDIAGKWSHWAFTKDAATGKMAIYLNGALWASDTGKHRSITVNRMTLGGAISSNLGYYGDLSRFALYAAPLDSSALVPIMQADQFGSPIYLLRLDEGSGESLHDQISNQNSILLGRGVWHRIRGIDLHSHFAQEGRPNVTLYQCSPAPTPIVVDRYIFDTIPDHASIVTRYAIGRSTKQFGNDSVITLDTTYGKYLATKIYTYDEHGVKVDSAASPAQDTVNCSRMYYQNRSPQKFELMSFVTPYGIFLDLGKTGKVWEFDVTDYLPVMKGWHRLTMERGSGQEEFDLKFLFIKGTPARPVLDMQQVWPMTEENYQTILADDRYEPRRIYLDPSAKGFKIRSYITGHGQEGEFIGRDHYISVNTTRYERKVWKECSSDPLYPQGGTWPLNRAGWCPGMATDLAEYEITGVVHPGDSVTMDYGVVTASGDSRYDPSTQVVTYGAPSFTRDAAIVDIQRPSDRIAYARINPACDQPIIVIRNNGTADLTTLNVEYYVDGGPHLTYKWTGLLRFLDTVSFALPVDSVSFWGATTTNHFHVDISFPTGDADEYDQNNHFSSNFTQPPAYKGIVVVDNLTNKNPEENSYEILNSHGDTVFSNGGFDPTTPYFDSLLLRTGCYTMVYHDLGEDGLNVWFNTAQGAGHLILRQTKKNGSTLHTFNADFGKFTQYDFSIAQSPLDVASDAVAYRRVSLYPNPAGNLLHVKLDGYPSEVIMLEVMNERGIVVQREQRPTGSPGSLDAMMNIEKLAKGSYFLRITTRNGSTVKGFTHE